jgi:hypothetical protein
VLPAGWEVTATSLGQASSPGAGPAHHSGAAQEELLATEPSASAGAAPAPTAVAAAAAAEAAAAEAAGTGAAAAEAAVAVAGADSAPPSPHQEEQPAATAPPPATADIATSGSSGSQARMEVDCTPQLVAASGGGVEGAATEDLAVRIRKGERQMGLP